MVTSGIEDLGAFFLDGRTLQKKKSIPLSNRGYQSGGAGKSPLLFYAQSHHFPPIFYIKLRKDLESSLLKN